MELEFEYEISHFAEYENSHFVEIMQKDKSVSSYSMSSAPSINGIKLDLFRRLVGSSRFIKLLLKLV